MHLFDQAKFSLEVLFNDPPRVHVGSCGLQWQSMLKPDPEALLYDLTNVQRKSLVGMRCQGTCPCIEACVVELPSAVV